MLITGIAGSGGSYLAVGEFLQLLIKLAKKPIPTRVDPALLRPSDVTLQIPSVEKFSETTGWKPQYKFQESVEHLLEYWRKRAEREANLI